MTAPQASTLADHRHHKPHPPYKISINGIRYEIHDRFRTGVQLKAIAGIPAGNHLFLEVPGTGEDEQIRDDFAVPMQDGLCFYDVPVGNLGCL